MVSVENLKHIITSQKEGIEELIKKERIIERDVDIKHLKKYIEHPNVLAIVGVRRCGKSIFTWLLLAGKKFGYINFFDERLSLKVDELNKIIEAFYELYGEVDYFVFDEIQNINGWERFVSRLRVSKKVIITGSNSKLLSSELATYLTGRHVDFELFPFNFHEYLSLNEIILNKNWIYSTKEVAKIKNLLKKFILQGGFPEVNKFGKLFLQTIYNDIIDKDVLARYGIKNIGALKTIARYLISSASDEFTFTKLKNIAGLKDVHTASNYVGYLESSYLVFVIERFSFKLKEQVIAPKKVYCTDTGLVNALSFKFSENIGKLMENLVAIELFRRKNYNFFEWKLYYFKDHQGREVDFVIKEGPRIKQLVQTTYASSIEEIKEREIKALLKASKELKCNDLLVITWDYEAKKEIKGKMIRFVPLWKWLLKD